MKHGVTKWHSEHSVGEIHIVFIVFHRDFAAFSFMLLQFFPHSAGRFILQMSFLVKPPNVVKPLVIRHMPDSRSCHAWTQRESEPEIANRSPDRTAKPDVL